jgi:hypothetical protein
MFKDYDEAIIAIEELEKEVKPKIGNLENPRAILSCLENPLPYPLAGVWKHEHLT